MGRDRQGILADGRRGRPEPRRDRRRMGDPTAIEVWMVDGNGTEYRRSWEDGARIDGMVPPRGSMPGYWWGWEGGVGRSALRGGECHEAPRRRLRRRQEWGFIGLDRHRRPGGLPPSRRLIRGLRRRVGSKRRGGRGSGCSWAGPGGNLLCQDLLISFSHAPPGPTSPRGPPRT